MRRRCDVHDARGRGVRHARYRHHKHVHVAVALDQLGRRLDELEIPATTAGFGELYAWASELGTIDTVGIEGTGAYGAGLTRWLRDRGVVVVEVERPDRKLRRNAGKSDPIDAEAAARKVISGEAMVVPKLGTGNVEMIRVLRIARRSAVMSRKQVTNQLHALTVTAPDVLREAARGAHQSSPGRDRGEVPAGQ